MIPNKIKMFLILESQLMTRAFSLSELYLFIFLFNKSFNILKCIYNFNFSLLYSDFNFLLFKKLQATEYELLINCFKLNLMIFVNLMKNTNS